MGLWEELRKNEIRTCTTREMFFMCILSGVIGVIVMTIACAVSR